MTISDLMAHLELLLATEGNLEVFVADNDGDDGEPIVAVQRDGEKRWVIL
jgi:hypothetical protein